MVYYISQIFQKFEEEKMIKKHSKIYNCNIILIVLLCFLIVNPPLWANIVVFFDNSGSMLQYKKNLQAQIKEIFEIAKKNNKNIVFVPIGGPYFKFANDFESAKKLFSFDDSYTFISDTLRSAEKKEIVSSQTQNIIIISDMESDITNTPGDYQFTSADYKDILDWYLIIIGWMEKDIDIHILLLSNNSNPSFGRKYLDRQEVITELNKLIEFSKQQENYERSLFEVDPDRSFLSTYIRNGMFNKLLTLRIVTSLPLLSKDSYEKNNRSSFHYIIQKDKLRDLFDIVEVIIDPSIITDYKIKIEIDPNVIDFNRPDQKYIRNLLFRGLPSLLNSNPPRRAIFKVINGSGKKIHDDAFYYHYRIMTGLLPGMINLILTNKFLSNSGEIILMKKSDRNKFNLRFTDNKDLIYTIFSELNNLKKYQEEDFPVSEKKIIISFKGDNVHLLRGPRLSTKKNVSTRISEIGQCTLKVKRQGNAEIFLVINSHKDYHKPKKLLMHIFTITNDQNRRGEHIILDTSQMPVNILVRNEIIPASSDFHGKFKLIPYDYSEYFEILDIPIPNSNTTIEMLPGSYYYSLIFDYSKNENACLNTWFIPFHVSFSKQKSNHIKLFLF